MSFEQFLAEQTEKSRDDKSKAGVTIAKFQTLISEFYGKIEREWLVDAVSKKQLALSKSSQSITEEPLGTYDVDVLSIEIGGKKITVKPVGTVLIGTDARFDLCYGHRESMIIHDKDDGCWKQVVRTGDRMFHKKVNADVFQKIIMELMK